MSLSNTQIKNAKPQAKAYRLHDGQGLYVEIRTTGKKFWRLRTRTDGRDTFQTLGQYPALTLADARKQRDDIKSGVVTTEPEKKETFQDIYNEWYTANEPQWSDSYTYQISSQMPKRVLPVIGDRDITSITARDVLLLLQDIEKGGAPTTAKSVRMWISAVYSHAIRTLRADSDPTAALRGAIKGKPVKHATALSREQFKKLIHDVDHNSSYRTTILAMHVLMLTMLRTGEVRQGEWSEIDLKNKVWTIPAERMKRRIAHIVPLSDQCIKFLIELKGITGAGKFLFPNMRDPRECMTSTTINTSLARAGWAGVFSGHGFRATSSTILNQNGFRSDLIERQLAHLSADKVRASYNHADYLNERRAMLRWWADYIDQLRAENNR